MIFSFFVAVFVAVDGPLYLQEGIPTQGCLSFLIPLRRIQVRLKTTPAATLAGARLTPNPRASSGARIPSAA